jgi:hypothetical protein
MEQYRPRRLNPLLSIFGRKVAVFTQGFPKEAMLCEVYGQHIYSGGER